MDSCAQGRAYRKWNNTQYLWPPRGLGTHWPGHPAADMQTVGGPKFFTRSATIRHSFRVTGEVSKQSVVLFDRASAPVSFSRPWLGIVKVYLCSTIPVFTLNCLYWRICSWDINTIRTKETTYNRDPCSKSKPWKVQFHINLDIQCMAALPLNTAPGLLLGGVTSGQNKLEKGGKDRRVQALTQRRERFNQ